MIASKIFGWIATIVSLCGVGYFGYRMVELMLRDPHSDPLPAAIGLFGDLYWFLLVAIVAFVTSMIMRFFERRG